MNTINYYYTPQKRERVIFIGNRKGQLRFTPYFTTFDKISSRYDS